MEPLDRPYLFLARFYALAGRLARSKELLAEYDRLKPEHTLRTFVDVEKLWAEVITPHLDDLLCVQEDFSGQGRKVSEDSVWYENRRNPDNK